jgi:hypothetical protein
LSSIVEVQTARELSLLQTDSLTPQLARDNYRNVQEKRSATPLSQSDGLLWMHAETINFSPDSNDWNFYAYIFTAYLQVVNNKTLAAAAMPDPENGSLSLCLPLQCPQMSSTNVGSKGRSFIFEAIENKEIQFESSFVASLGISLTLGISLIINEARCERHYS